MFRLPTFKTLAATALAGTLALGGMSAPVAAADRGEVVRTIVGIAALGLLLNELSKNDDRAQSHRPAPWRPVDRGHRYDRPRVLPASCVFEVRERGWRREVIGERCIEQQLRQSVRLPSSCALTVPVRHDRAVVYGTDCLKRAGYRIGRRR